MKEVIFAHAIRTIENESLPLVWDIPSTADKNRGDLGLLPEDTEIGTWPIPRSSGSFLYFLAISSGAKLILELGASVGYSTAWLALAAKQNAGHVHSTEIFAPKAAIARTNLALAGVGQHVTVHEKDILNLFEEYLSQPWTTRKQFDLVFMDADKQRYVHYLEKMWPLLTQGAIVIVDNVGNYPQHMADFLTEVRKLEGSAVHFLPVDNGLLLITKGKGSNLLPFFPELLPNPQED